jgi:hypothetical protein
MVGALIGTATSALWVTRMPTGCVGGASIAFATAIVQTGSGLGWRVYGIGLLPR